MRATTPPQTNQFRAELILELVRKGSLQEAYDNLRSMLAQVSWLVLSCYAKLRMPSCNSADTPSSPLTAADD